MSSDNITLNATTGGPVARSKALVNSSGVTTQTQVVALDIGGEGYELQVGLGNPMPTSEQIAINSDSPLFVSIAGDPDSDYAGINILEQVIDPNTGLQLQVNVANQIATDPLASNKGILLADSQGWAIGAGETIVLDTTGYNSVVIHCIAGTVTVTQSNSLTPSSFISIANIATSALGVLPTNALSSATMGYMGVSARYLKFVMNPNAGASTIIYLRTAQVPLITNSSGTPIEIASINSSPIMACNLSTINGTVITSAGLAGTIPVGGTVAAGTAINSNPVIMGGMVRTSTVTTGTTGQAANMVISSGGALVTVPYSVPDNQWQATSGTTALATTTSTALKAAGAAGIRNYLAGLQLFNTSATVSTTVTILDGSTVIWVGYLPAMTSTIPMVPLDIDFDSIPLKGTAATAMFIQLGTTGAAVYYSVQGFQAP